MSHTKEPRPDFSEMREMLRAMQAGELTVSRGIEILDMWHAGNWNDDMLPPVRQDLIELDFMPVEIIDRLKQQRDELLARLDVVCEVQVVSATYERIRAQKVFAIDDIEYDLFAAGWKEAISTAKGVA